MNRHWFLTGGLISAHTPTGTPPPPANQPPVAAFTTAVNGLAVTFDASASTDPDGTITNYTWNPGDGGAWGPNVVSFTKTYAAAGTYTVTLYVSDNTGAQSRVSHTVTLTGGTANQPPTATFTTSVNGLAVTVNGAGSADPDGTITGYDWNWGDGTGHGSGQTTAHSYATAGSKTVTLTVTDNVGATASTTRTVTTVTTPTTNQPPTATFTTSVNGATVTVDGSGSSDPDGTVTGYQWAWGDGGTSTGATATHTYSSSGSKTVTLTVTDNAGATNSTTRTVTVTVPATGTVPAWSHIVVVLMENKSLNEAIASGGYFTTFRNQGVSFASSFAIEHPSQPNYLDLFGGQNYGITDDNIHWSTQPSIYSQMVTAGKTFKAYSESLPSAGFSGDGPYPYARKHCPWVTFQQDSTSNPSGYFPGSLHRPFTEWQQSPAFYAALPQLTYVIPNLVSDVHDASLSTGSTWLQNNLDGYAQWAKTNNSLLMITFDEDDSSQGNQIYTAVVGAHAPAGTTYASTVNHYHFLGLMQDVLGLPRLNNSVGKAQITGCWN